MKVLGDLSPQFVLFADLAETVLPCSNLIDSKNDEVEAPTDPRFTIAHTMELFTTQVTDVSMPPIHSEGCIDFSRPSSRFL